jgi:acyl carrier protein
MAVSSPITEIARTVANLLHVPPQRVTSTTPLTELVTDSFVLVELVIDLQEEYGVRFEQDDVQRVRTVQDLADLVSRRRAA